MRPIDSVAVMRSDMALLYVPELGEELIEMIDVRGVHPRSKGQVIPVSYGPSGTVASLAGSLRGLHVKGDYLHARLEFADSPRGENLADLFHGGHLNFTYPPFDYVMQRNRWVKKGRVLQVTDVTMLSVTVRAVPSRMFQEDAAVEALK